MHLLGVGRQAFLEFLRNLTPQALILAFGLNLWSQLDFHQFDIRNWGKTLAFNICATTWILAVIANMIQFVSNYYSAAFPTIDVRMTKARRRLPDTNSRFKLLWRSLKKFKWTVTFHLVTTLLLIEIAFFASTWFGIQQAIRLLSSQ